MSEWAAGSFIIPKKDGTVRWISDFRDLNKCLVSKTFPLPKIQDLLQQRTGYKYFTKIDISMQYYTFELDEASKDLCTIVTPFGKYRYCRLPMGVKVAPDISQAYMEDVFRSLEEVKPYLDDASYGTYDWAKHMEILDKTLALLDSHNFSVNPRKCEFAVRETDWLGYWMTPTGLKPWKKKIEAILQIQPPTNIKQLRSFLGCVNYY